MNILEKVLALIGAAKETQNEVRRRELLSMAEELLSAPTPAGSKETARTSQLVENVPLTIYARRKGKRHEAILAQGWKVQMNGQWYTSPSAAASTVAGHPVNGWMFWRYQNQFGLERPIDDLRKRPVSTDLVAASVGILRGKGLSTQEFLEERRRERERERAMEEGT